MRKVGLTILLLCALLAACSSPTDKPGQRWAEFLETQTELVKAGKFNVTKFEAEGKEIAANLNMHRDPKTGKFLMTEDVLARFKEANANFELACKEAEDLAALAAFDRVTGPLLKPDAPPANSD